MIKVVLFILVVAIALILWKYIPQEDKAQIRQHVGRAFWPIVIAIVLGVILLVLALTTTIKVI